MPHLLKIDLPSRLRPAGIVKFAYEARSSPGTRGKDVLIGAPKGKGQLTGQRGKSGSRGLVPIWHGKNVPKSAGISLLPIWHFRKAQEPSTGPSPKRAKIHSAFDLTHSSDMQRVPAAIGIGIAFSMEQQLVHPESACGHARIRKNDEQSENSLEPVA